MEPDKGLSMLKLKKSHENQNDWVTLRHWLSVMAQDPFLGCSPACPVAAESQVQSTWLKLGQAVSSSLESDA